MNKINQFLKRDNIQRRCYFVLLISWIVIFLNPDLRSFVTSYDTYLPLIFIVPVLLLVLQLLFNNRIIWTMISACIVLYTLWTLIKMYMYIVVDSHRDYSPVEWNAATVFRFGLIVLILIMFNWFIFKIKPVKSDRTIT